MSAELSNLARLHQNGDLTDAEFERAKKKLLG
ncbi:MAG: SHOCT domain-containing protein [Chloroflexota bacterium]